MPIHLSPGPTATLAVAAVAVAAFTLSPAPFATTEPRAGPALGAAASVRVVVADRTAASASDVPSAPRWRWPLAPRPKVLRRFVAPTSTWGAGHRGLDLVTSRGAAVRAVDGGRVSHAGTLAGRGTVTVAHADGLRSTYEPVRPSVMVGEVVVAGSTLGRVEAGGTHCGVQACLHLGAVDAVGYRDPLPLLAGGRIRLFPSAPSG